MRVSGIATVYNEEETVELFFESYRRQVKYCDELIIIDGGSQDDTVERLEEIATAESKLNIRIFRIPESDLSCPGQIALGRNIAIEKAVNDIIVCFDFGCTYSSNYVSEMSKKLLRFDVVGGYFYGLNSHTKYGRIYSDTMMPSRASFSQGLVPSSRSVAFKRHVWTAVGGYPTKYLTGEDTYFILKILDHEFMLGYSQDVNVGWLNPHTLASIFSKHRNYGRGKYEFSLMSKKTFFLKLLVIIASLPFTIIYKSLLVRVVVYMGELTGYSQRFFLKKFIK